MTYATFHMDVRVHDAKALYQAALQHLTKVDGLTDDGARDFLGGGGTPGQIDINACLVALLDPGSLPGCDIQESHVT